MGEANQAVTLPFTAQQSGFMRMSIQASSNQSAYWYIKSQKYGNLYAALTTINRVSGTSGTTTAWFFVEQGDVLEHQESSGTASQSLWFIPLTFPKENQMFFKSPTIT